MPFRPALDKEANPLNKQALFSNQPNQAIGRETAAFDERGLCSHQLRANEALKRRFCKEITLEKTDAQIL